MKQFHIRDWFEKYQPHSNLIFWVSMIKESLKIVPKNKNRKIVDFGCGDGYFFNLFEMIDDFKEAIGIEIDDDLLEQAKNNEKDNVKFIKYDKSFFEKNRNRFDIVYSQEVLYTIKDLKHHAKEIFDILKSDGYYFATMGSHIQNPLWSHRRNIIRKEFDEGKCSYYAYDYSLDEVANIFHSVGFEVGLKRLPLEYFMVYSPSLTREFSNSFYELVKTSEEHKMLFLFWKPNK